MASEIGILFSVLRLALRDLIEKYEKSKSRTLNKAARKIIANVEI